MSQPSKLRDFLANTQLWRGLPDDQLDAIATIAIAKSYHKGEVIFVEGEEGIGFFIVQSGRIKVFKLSAEGKEQILKFFGVGEHFAEVPAFDGECFPASATALEKTELLFFERTAFLALLDQHPKIAVNMLSIFARHLRQFAQLIEDLSLKEVPGRLAAYLLYLREKSESKDYIELDITKTQLASLLGTIPETLSRVFAKLSHEELISIQGSKISLRNPEGLWILSQQGSMKTKG